MNIPGTYSHVRDGRDTVGHDRFNEAFMMHASTSPLYPIIASNEVSPAMMDEAGRQLMAEAITEAIDFRQTVMRFRRDLKAQGEWFLATWNPDAVIAQDGQRVAFEDADAAWLGSQPACWALHPGEDWHGYGQIEDSYALLDPIKAGVWIVGGVGFLATVFAFVVGCLPTSDAGMSAPVYIAIMLGGTALLSIIPVLIILQFRKPSCAASKEELAALGVD